jgi:hypothetical protein
MTMCAMKGHDSCENHYHWNSLKFQYLEAHVAMQHETCGISAAKIRGFAALLGGRCRHRWAASN